MSKCFFLALTIIIGLEGMHFGNFWPPRTPGGRLVGMEGSGGVRGTKNCNFFGSHIWVPNCEILDCMNGKHLIFQIFGQKQPQPIFGHFGAILAIFGPRDKIVAD